VEADAGFFGDASGIGIESLEKVLDLLLDLPTGQRADLSWLNLLVHPRLHPYSSQKKLSLSFQGSCDPSFCYKHMPDG
jgi:hypothetical protein